MPFKLLGMSSTIAEVRRIDPDDRAPHDIIVLVNPKAQVAAPADTRQRI